MSFFWGCLVKKMIEHLCRSEVLERGHERESSLKTGGKNHLLKQSSPLEPLPAKKKLTSIKHTDFEKVISYKTERNHTMPSWHFSPASIDLGKFHAQQAFLPRPLGHRRCHLTLRQRHAQDLTALGAEAHLRLGDVQHGAGLWGAQGQLNLQGPGRVVKVPGVSHLMEESWKSSLET